MNLNYYIQTLNIRFKSGISREYSTRTDLENLIRELGKGVEITNEPTNVTDCGNPDYVIPKGKIPVGYIGKDLTPETVKAIAKKLGLGLVAEKEPEGNVCFINSPEVRDDFKTTFAPIDLLDYIYAVLNSPTYREKYKGFLEVGFQRVPYPKDTDTFWQLVKLGGELRRIHLFESAKVGQFITQYPVDGTNTVGRIKYDPTPTFTKREETKHPGYMAASPSSPLERLVEVVGKVWINDEQYFDHVPLVAWEFYIGGFQPAQRWLKDRKDRVLDFDDLLHYKKIIVALTETDRIMKAIDQINFEA